MDQITYRGSQGPAIAHKEPRANTCTPVEVVLNGELERIMKLRSFAGEILARLEHSVDRMSGAEPQTPAANPPREAGCTLDALRYGVTDLSEIIGRFNTLVDRISSG